MGVNIAQNGASMRHVDSLVAATSLSLWAFLFVTCLLGLYATWRDRLRLFTVFWFAFLFHWVLDLVSTIGFLIVAYQRDAIQSSSETCLRHGLGPGCTVPVDVMLVIVTVILCLFKVITAYALYVMYKHRLTLARSQHPPSPTHKKSSPKSISPSTPTRLSPFKPKFKAFAKSPRQGRPWPPTNIPTIKIDLASDQSSASSYSNGSSGTGSAGFAVFEFAAKYPSLRTMPLEPIGENLKAALEREKKKDEVKEREREEVDLGLVKVRNASRREETVTVPTLPKFSVVGSDQGY